MINRTENGKASGAPVRSRHTSRRFASERRFKLAGLLSVCVAAGFLVLLLATILGNAIPAFTYHTLSLNVDLSEKYVDPAKIDAGKYRGAVSAALEDRLPFANDRRGKKLARALISTGSPALLKRRVLADPALVGQTIKLEVPLSDSGNLYLKGLLGQVEKREAMAPFQIEIDGSNATILSAELAATLGKQLNSDAELKLGSEDRSVLINSAKGWIKLTSLSLQGGKGIVLLPPIAGTTSGGFGGEIVLIERPEAERKISDIQIVWLEHLQEAGAIESRFNSLFFTNGASREPEMAGIRGAIIGSFLTLVVTLLLSFPIGVAAAVYLEEFAPKNRLTDLIEVNINNLAAVPSIVFGLLGLAVFLNFAELPRSAPLVGGMVLALMTLPTIIIASRAALKAVPPSIREAAFGVGASPIQTVFHHVLPLAMPGMLTGTIIGMAQALGETAPLLMIGMVAFIVDIPGGFTDPSTVLPVQIFMWADFPEIGFQQKTAAAILVLLVFLILMNAIAVLLRKRFERRW